MDDPPEHRLTLKPNNTRRLRGFACPPVDAVLLGFAVIGVVLLSLGSLGGPGKDQAIFTLIGERLAAGQMPYRDLWDHKPPGIYLIAALAALLPGAPWPAMWLLSVVATIGMGFLVRMRAGTTAGCSAMLIVTVLAGPGMTETFAALAAAAAVAAGRRPLLVGLLAGAAWATSLQFVVLALVMPLALGWRMLPRYLVGCLGIVAVIAAWLAMAGALPAAWDTIVVYSRIYLGLDRSQDLPQLLPLVLMLLPISMCAIAGRARRLPSVWLIIGTIAILMQGRLFPHYGVLLVIPLAWLGARAPSKLQLQALAGTAALAVLVVASQPLSAVAANRETGDWIQLHTKPSDRILMWGHEAGIYLDSDRAPAGRYPYLLPLTTPGYTTSDTIDDWMAQLNARPPAVIVDVEAANPFWVDGADFLRPPPPGSAGGRNLDMLAPFRWFVAKRYRLLAIVDDRKIYGLIE